jgi:hypothetical protein
MAGTLAAPLVPGLLAPALGTAAPIIGAAAPAVGLYGAGIPSLNNADIFGYTHDVATLMVNTPGRTLFINDTGHSIHDERPAFFAGEIIHFLTEPDVNLRIDLQNTGDDARWNSQVWAFLATGKGTYFIPLNAWWHAWNPNPPAIDNPCSPVPPCNQINFFQLPPANSDSTSTFTIGLSRTGLQVNEIQSFGIQFVGGQSRPTDTGDNWDLSGITLSQPGAGTLFQASGNPLARLTSPSSYWATALGSTTPTPAPPPRRTPPPDPDLQKPPPGGVRR